MKKLAAKKLTANNTSRITVTTMRVDCCLLPCSAINFTNKNQLPGYSPGQQVRYLTSGAVPKV